jgi:hypothetical protein
MSNADRVFRLPSVIVSTVPEETLTFADGTTITRWSRSISDGHSPTLWLNNYVIRAPDGNCCSMPHSYHENETQ